MAELLSFGFAGDFRCHPSTASFQTNWSKSGLHSLPGTFSFHLVSMFFLIAEIGGCGFGLGQNSHLGVRWYKKHVAAFLDLQEPCCDTARLGSTKCIKRPSAKTGCRRIVSQPESCIFMLNFPQPCSGRGLVNISQLTPRVVMPLIRTHRRRHIAGLCVVCESKEP